MWQKYKSIHSVMYLLVVWLFTNWPIANGLSGFKVCQERSHVNWDPLVLLRAQNLKGKILIWVITKEFQKEKQYI